MGRNSGKIVTWTREDGTPRQGVAMHKDQKPGNKAFVRILDSDYKLTGEFVTVEIAKLKAIGMYD